MSIINKYFTNINDIQEIETQIKKHCLNGFDNTAYKDFAEKILTRNLTNPQTYLKSATIRELQLGSFNLNEKTETNEDYSKYEKLVSQFPNINSTFFYLTMKAALKGGATFNEWEELIEKMKAHNIMETKECFEKTIKGSKFAKRYKIDFKPIEERVNALNDLLEQCDKPCCNCQHFENYYCKHFEKPTLQVVRTKQCYKEA